jgi:hypothetical protein
MYAIAGVFFPITFIWLLSTIQSPQSSPNIASSRVESLVTQSASASEVLSKEVVLAEQIAKVFASSCPISDPGDDKARQQCATKLAKNQLLRDSMPNEVKWGGQKELGHFKLSESKTTTFNPLVLRRLYLSTYMYTGKPKIEQVDKLTVIHLPVQFRNQLDSGSFPYPFWHSEKKWDSYQKTTEVLLMMESGKIQGGLRWQMELESY